MADETRLDPKEHESRVRAHYLPLLAKHGDTNLVVDFQHAGNHQARFSILAGIDDISEVSLLDVGCGIGHFAGWLAKRDFRGDYIGIDLLPEMVERARNAHPGFRFERADLLDPKTHYVADYVMSSGIFHLGDQDFMHRMIAAMYASCRKGVAFNSLSSWDLSGSQGHFFRADPLKTLDFCRGLSSQILMRHDYLPHDFTIFMFRE